MLCQVQERIVTGSNLRARNSPTVWVSYPLHISLMAKVSELQSA
jgi:hypothetical protein